MWVEFVVSSLLAPRGFSPGTPVSPSPQKPTVLNSNLIQKFKGHSCRFVSHKTARCYPRLLNKVGLLIDILIDFI